MNNPSIKSNSISLDYSNFNQLSLICVSLCIPFESKQQKNNFHFVASMLHNPIYVGGIQSLHASAGIKSTLPLQQKRAVRHFRWRSLMHKIFESWKRHKSKKQKREMTSFLKHLAAFFCVSFMLTLKFTYGKRQTAHFRLLPFYQHFYNPRLCFFVYYSRTPLSYSHSIHWVPLRI